jgi:hypothetical protein
LQILFFGTKIDRIWPKLFDAVAMRLYTLIKIKLQLRCNAVTQLTAAITDADYNLKPFG